MLYWYEIWIGRWCFVPFDGLVLAAVRRELCGLCTGGRLERVQQPAPDQLVLLIRSRGEKFRLLVSAHATGYRAHLTASAPANPPSPYTFCQVLRKHLEGARIETIEQPGFERVLRIALGGRDELGRPFRKTLVAEFMGKHSNIILVDEDGIILDGIKRYTHAVSRLRQVLPGAEYVSPKREKKDPLDIDEEGFMDAVTGKGLGISLAAALQQSFEGLSRVMAGELLYRANLPADIRVEECGVYELRAVMTSLRNLFLKALAGRFRPGLLLGAAGQPVDFAAFPLEGAPGIQWQEYTTMNEAIDRFYTSRLQSEAVEEQRRALLGIVNREVKKIDRRLEDCRSVIGSAGEAEQNRIYGELITANIHQLQQGADQAMLTNFAVMREVTVPLDPALSPSANAQRYFKRYRKQKGAVARACEETKSLENEKAYLEAVETSIVLAAGLDELSEIREELVQQGYLSGNKTAPKQAGRPSPVAEPLSFAAPNEMRILVGRNNRQNDIVTFKLGKDEDVWLHARGVPGAHVVIKTAGREVDPDTLEKAASLAAYFSRARLAPSVPVDYTLRKYVKKPRGAKPGLVIYTNEKTLTVSPSPP